MASFHFETNLLVLPADKSAAPDPARVPDAAVKQKATVRGESQTPLSRPGTKP